MLMPKRVKRRKQFRGSMAGKALRGNKITNGEYGIIATETMLCSFLSEIKGVGDVNVMMEYDENRAVTGVIVTAEGASDPVVKNDIVKGVATLFDLPVSSVMVFEKSQED